MVAVSLFPVFLVFFSDGNDEITVSPGNLAATFVAFGESKRYITHISKFLNTFLLSCLFYNTLTLPILLSDSKSPLSSCHPVLNIAFALSVLGFLIMHIMLVARNTTTIEVKQQLSLGFCSNLVYLYFA